VYAVTVHCDTGFPLTRVVLSDTKVILVLAVLIVSYKTQVPPGIVCVVTVDMVYLEFTRVFTSHIPPDKARKIPFLSLIFYTARSVFLSIVLKGYWLEFSSRLQPTE